MNTFTQISSYPNKKESFLLYNMIQAIRETNFTAYIETEAKRIDTSVPSSKIRHLVKFINDLDGKEFYVYAALETITNRYTKLEFDYSATPDVYTSVKLVPAGFYKYELYEVSWTGAVAVSSGILYLAEKSGSEEVQYTEYEAPTSTNTIYYGQ